MSDLEKLKEKHEDLTRVIDNLEKERNEVRQAIAEINCPFKVGDRIISNKGMKAEVTGISHWNNYRYKIRIKQARKDGRLFFNDKVAWESDGWKLDREKK